jgi:hypothetical protein
MNCPFFINRFRCPRESAAPEVVMLLIFETLALRFPMSLSFVAGATAFGLISLPRFGAAADAGCCAGGLAQGSVGSASSIMLDVEDVAPRLP